MRLHQNNPFDDPDLVSLAQRFLDLPDVACAPQRVALFTYLWDHRTAHSPIDGIWNGALHKLSRAKDKDDSHYDFRRSVRTQCDDLRGIIRKFADGIRGGWCIEFPEAIPGVGYRLECFRLDEPPTLTEIFWRPHLESSSDISLIYAQQLFFEDPDEGMVFRYFDCNAEHSAQGLDELKTRHRTEFRRHTKLLPTYPYVAWGETETKNAITRWFEQHTLTKIGDVRTRDLDYDEERWKQSLILFGAAFGNRFVTRALDSYPDLPMKLSARTQVTIWNPTPDERIALDGQPDVVTPVYAEGDCTLNFRSDKGYVPVILTRVANPEVRVSDAPVTIFNSHFGTAVFQMAHILTDERSLKDALATLRIPLPFPSSFQVLCAAPMRVGDNRRVKPLAWRPHAPAGVPREADIR